MLNVGVKSEQNAALYARRRVAVSSLPRIFFLRKKKVFSFFFFFHFI